MVGNQAYRIIGPREKASLKCIKMKSICHILDCECHTYIIVWPDKNLRFGKNICVHHIRELWENIPGINYIINNVEDLPTECISGN